MAFIPKLRSGVHESPQGRSHMEDTHIRIDSVEQDFVHAALLKDSKLSGRVAFYGVFDGHAGFGAACYVRDNLLRLILEGHAAGAPESGWTSSSVRAAITGAFLKADLEIYERCDKSAGGTVALASLIVGDTMFVANVGDCRAHMSRCDAEKWTAMRVSTDHSVKKIDTIREVQRRVVYLDEQLKAAVDREPHRKPWLARPDRFEKGTQERRMLLDLLERAPTFYITELERVEATGGHISHSWMHMHGCNDPKEEGGSVAITRALGDWHHMGRESGWGRRYEEFPVELKKLEAGQNVGPLSAEPQIEEIKLREQDEFMILATDGLSMADFYQVVPHARTSLQLENDPQRASQVLVEEFGAMFKEEKDHKYMRPDNVAVITICFQQTPPSATAFQVCSNCGARVETEFLDEKRKGLVRGCKSCHSLRGLRHPWPEQDDDRFWVLGPDLTLC